MICRCGLVGVSKHEARPKACTACEAILCGHELLLTPEGARICEPCKYPLPGDAAPVRSIKATAVKLARSIVTPTRGLYPPGYVVSSGKVVEFVKR